MDSQKDRPPQRSTLQLDLHNQIDMADIPRMIEAWLFQLKHIESYHDHVADSSDPYNKAVSTYQAFTKSIINGLERKDPETVSLVEDRYLESVFSEIPTKPDAKALQLWIKDAMLKHPLRRTERQYLTFALIRAQECGEIRSIKSKVLAAIGDFVE